MFFTFHVNWNWQSNSLCFTQMGVVSDDELLDLLHLALSSDTPETVKRARELMRSRIDPLQLISQLANLIMDILAGKCQEETSEVKRRIFRKYTCKYQFLYFDTFGSLYFSSIDWSYSMWSTVALSNVIRDLSALC